MLGLDNIMGDAALALVQDASSVETYHLTRLPGFQPIAVQHTPT